MKHFRIAALVAASLLSSLAGAASIAINTAAHGGNGGDRSSSSSAMIRGAVPIEEAQRVFVYSEDRNWYTTDGRILICPFELEVFDKKKCYAKDDKTYANRWVQLNDFKVPGHEISSITYSVGRYERWLIVYYRKEGTK